MILHAIHPNKSRLFHFQQWPNFGTQFLQNDLQILHSLYH